MIPISPLFLNEGIVGRFINSISNIAGKRRSTQPLAVRPDTVNKIAQGGESIKRSIPRPTSDNDKLGFKPPRILRIPR
jgi:hypothetical protein